MFKRDHHIKIATLLQAMNSDILDHYNCLFGGGTAIALTQDEFRESLDLDFLISDSKSYQGLREKLKSEGIQSLARSGMILEAVSDIRVDQYGIRAMLKVSNTEVKFEIVYEARIKLEAPPAGRRVCGVSVLTPLDMASTKLLANSDRWSDDSVFSRDLIDLAMIRPSESQLHSAIEKSEMAYGNTIKKDLSKAIRSLAERKGRLEKCMEALKIEIPRAVLWARIRDLKIDPMF